MHSTKPPQGYQARILFRGLLAVGCAAFASCTTTTSESERQSAEWSAQHLGFRQTETWKRKAFVNDEVVQRLDPKSISIVIHLDEQRGLVLHQGRDVAMDFPVSTGKRGFRTKPGSYNVIGKHRSHASNLYGKFVCAESGKVVADYADTTRHATPEGARFVGSPMPYFMRLNNQGLGLHVGPLPGYAASHGCIRLPNSVMPDIFRLSPIGTPVVILEQAPKQDDA